MVLWGGDRVTNAINKQTIVPTTLTVNQAAQFANRAISGEASSVLAASVRKCLRSCSLLPRSPSVGEIFRNGFEFVLPALS